MQRRIGDIDASIETLKTAVSQLVHKAATDNNLGLSYFDAGKYEEA